MNFNLIRDIAAAVDGIPTLHFNLDVYQNAFLETHQLQTIENPHCNSIGCVAGWMVLHPTLSRNVPPARWRTRIVDEIMGYSRISGGPPNYAETMKWYETNDLFKGIDDVVDNRRLDHKIVFAHRVIKFLQEHGQPISDAYLAKYGEPE